jgi:hypothetical protein
METSGALRKERHEIEPLQFERQITALGFGYEFSHAAA